MEKKGANGRFKDRFFRFLFGNESRKEYTLSLYNALNGTDYTDVNDLEITTIDDVIYMDMKNDVSFLIDGEMNLIEHQSTYNPNMPVRGLAYFSKLFNNYIETNNLDIYGPTLVPLPVPRYIVLYNGGRKIRNRTVLRLSDAFGDRIGNIEITAEMIDINCDSPDSILENCPELKGYALFVGKVKEYSAKDKNLKKAVDRAVDECIEVGILSDILLKFKSEVKEMILTEYNSKRHENNVYAVGIAEGEAKGRAEGRAEGKLSIISDIMRGRNMDFDAACREAFISDEERNELKAIYMAGIRD